MDAERRLKENDSYQSVYNTYRRSYALGVLKEGYIAVGGVAAILGGLIVG